MKIIDTSRLSVGKKRALVIVIIMMVAIPSFMLGNVMGISAGSGWADTNTYIGPGSMVNGASYTVFIDDSNAICAKNGYTGQISYRDGNASLVIQSIIDKFKSDGEAGTIHFTSGTYNIDTSINITNLNGVVLTGEGITSILRMENGANCNILRMYAAHDAIIENLMFDGNKAANTVGSCILQIGGINTAYSNLLIRDAPEYGLYIHGYNPPTVTISTEVVNADNVYVTACVKAGVYVYGAGDVHFRGVTSEVTSTAGEPCFKLYGMNRGVLDNCYSEIAAGTLALNMSYCQSVTVTGGTYYGPIRIDHDYGTLISNIRCRPGSSITPINVTYPYSAQKTIIISGDYDKSPPIEYPANVTNVITIYVPGVTGSLGTDYGVAYMPGTVTNVTVNHTLGEVPDFVGITVISTGTGISGPIWIEGLSATQFYIHRNSTADWAYIMWKAEVIG